MSRIMSSSVTSATSLTVAFAVAENSFAQTTSTGIGTEAPRADIIVDDVLCALDQVGLGQRLADLQAGGQHEGVGDAAADDQVVDLVGQGFQDRQLGRHFRAGDDGHQRMRRLVQRAAQRVELGAQQRAGAGDGRELGDAVGGGFGAVGGAECVVHIDVAQLGHLLRQLVAILLLARVDPAVFQQHHLAGNRRRRRRPSPASAPPAGPAARTGGARPAPACPRGLNAPSVGRPRWEVTITAAPASSACADGRHRGADAGVFGDIAGIVLRHVEIGADEHALALELTLLGQVGEANELHVRRGW